MKPVQSLHLCGKIKKTVTVMCWALTDIFSSICNHCLLFYSWHSHCIIFVYSSKTVCFSFLYISELLKCTNQISQKKLCKSSLGSSMHPFQVIQSLVLGLQKDVVCERRDILLRIELSPVEPIIWILELLEYLSRVSPASFSFSFSILLSIFSLCSPSPSQIF